MTKQEKLRAKILARPAEIGFDDLKSFLESEGWNCRPSRSGGSHCTFWKEGVAEILTVPTVGSRKGKRGYILQVIKTLGLED